MSFQAILIEISFKPNKKSDGLRINSIKNFNYQE